MEYQTFEISEFPLESGFVLPQARVAYQSYGRLNADKTNAVLLCSFYTGDHTGYDFLMGPDHCFDPDRYFVISTNLFCNGLSSSPSNTPAPLGRGAFPPVSIRDNVRAQHALVTQRYRLDTLAMVAGFSMGAQQAFQWAVSYPDMVERIAPWCGHAHTTPHTFVFLDGLEAALKTDAAWSDGYYTEPPRLGLRAMARVAAGWPFSQAWYRKELYKTLGYPTLHDFLIRFWEGFLLPHDATDLLGNIQTWKMHNVGSTPGFDGDYKKALGTIRARTVILPGETDLYFPPEDSMEEAACIEHAELKTIRSVWGHFAGIGLNPEDASFIDHAISDCLAK